MKFIFNKLNSYILIIGIIITVAAYIIMGTGDKIISPILLIITYLVIFPLAIITGSIKKNRDSASTE